MAEVSATIEVDQPAERVWAALTAPDRQGGWMPATRVAATRGNGSSVGDRLEARTGIGPLGLTDVMHVTDIRPPARWQVRHVGRVVRGAGTFEVFDLGSGTRVVWTEYLDPPLGVAGQVGWLLVRRGVRAGMRAALRRLAASA